MADNYLEKRYREVFGEGSRVDPETGYETSRPKAGISGRLAGLHPKKSSPTPDKDNNDTI